MSAPRETSRKVLSREAGQAMVEYAIIIFVMVIALVAFFTTFTVAVENHFAYLAGIWSAPVP